MGLDAVEIVMAIEEAFDIRIEDSEAEKLFTPGEVISLVALKTSRSQNTECLTQRAFNRLRVTILQHTSRSRSEIKPDTRVVELLPRRDRRSVIGKILSSIGVKAEPCIHFPGWFILLIAIGSMVVGVVTVGVFSNSSSIPEMIPIGGLIGFVVFVGILWSVRGMGGELAKSQATVGDLARWVVTQQPDFLKIEPGKWSREQIAERVRLIVIEQLDCADRYREDARFIEDLGVD